MTRPRAVAAAAVVVATAVVLLAPGPVGRGGAGALAASVASTASTASTASMASAASMATPVVGPTVSLSSASAPVGSAVIVELSGWPAGVVTVSVCGDEARRGSVDCDQVRAHGVGIAASGAGTVRVLVAPPVGCPCVVRVSTPSSDLVRTVPIDVPGLAVLAESELGPELLPSAGVVTFEVTAGLEPDDDWSTSAMAAIGGPVDRRLVLTVRNTGAAPVAGVSISGAIGRTHEGGVPLAVPVIGTLGPGEERTVPVAVPMPVLAAGRFVVFGRVDSMAGAASFETPTDAHPWGVLVIVAIAAVVVIGKRTRRPVRSNVSGTTVSDHDTSIPAGVQLGDGGGRAPGRGEQHEQRLVGVGAPDGDGVRRAER